MGMSNVILMEVPQGSSSAQGIRYQAGSQTNGTDFKKDLEDLSDEKGLFVQKEVVPELLRPRAGNLRNRVDCQGIRRSYRMRRFGLFWRR
jgi:hypothetical protein